uniref:Retrotransposon gag domain-containing protein n=1 Tax=Cajanus cajan TaxID=3821 RepID=A0A151T8C9_CAJCA|nr:hypothetical protein KK1_017872 [Cajanus cajan]
MLANLIVNHGNGETRKPKGFNESGPSKLRHNDGERPSKPSRGKHIKGTYRPKRKHIHTHITSNKGFYGSHHYDYYQRPPTQQKPRHEHREPKVDLPYFYGRDNVEESLDWEIKVEQLFICHKVSKEKKVHMATLSFQGKVMHWWTSLERDKRFRDDPPIQYWNELRSSLRRRHIPSYYATELMDKLQRLQ